MQEACLCLGNTAILCDCDCRMGKVEGPTEKRHYATADWISSWDWESAFLLPSFGVVFFQETELKSATRGFHQSRVKAFIFIFIFKLI